MNIVLICLTKYTVASWSNQKLILFFIWWYGLLESVFSFWYVYDRIHYKVFSLHDTNLSHSCIHLTNMAISYYIISGPCWLIIFNDKFLGGSWIKIYSCCHVVKFKKAINKKVFESLFISCCNCRLQFLFLRDRYTYGISKWKYFKVWFAAWKRLQLYFRTLSMWSMLTLIWPHVQYNYKIYLDIHTSKKEFWISRIFWQFTWTFGGDGSFGSWLLDWFLRHASHCFDLCFAWQ